MWVGAVGGEDLFQLGTIHGFLGSDSLLNDKTVQRKKLHELWNSIRNRINKAVDGLAIFMSQNTDLIL